jgi:tetratricopeptide (TPR) repeat protein
MLIVVVSGLVVYFGYDEIRRDSGSHETHVHTPATAESAGMLQEIDRLQKTVDANPADDASLLRLANVLHDHAMRDRTLLMRAVNTYGTYLKRKPGDTNARVDMGICYFEMGRLDSVNGPSFFARAIDEMTKAFNGNPSHQPAAFNLGIVNLNAGHLEESNAWFKKALALNPDTDLGKRAKQILEQHTF